MVRQADSSMQSFDSDFLDDFDAAQKLIETLGISDSPASILQKHLSVRSVISTTSSFAQRQQAASEALGQQQFRVIGSGTCGRVYEEPGSPLVIKLERNHHFGAARGLKNDFETHKRVFEAFQRRASQASLDVHVPQPWLLISAEDPWWNGNEHLFKQDPVPANIIKMERILPLSQSICNALIEQWCPSQLREATLADPSNHDCLIRPYLGKVKQQRIAPQKVFSLRNFNMHIDQFEQLGLHANGTTTTLATAMADALAVLHWDVGVDACDVEFVLGSVPTFKCYPHSFTKAYNSEARDVHFWLLDFNQVQSMSRDEAGIEQAIRAFCNNDLYYPRPGKSPDWLWNEFKARYMVTSTEILEEEASDEDKDLPRMFMEALESKLGKMSVAAKAAIERRKDE